MFKIYITNSYEEKIYKNIQKILVFSKNLVYKNFKFQQENIRKTKNGHFWYVHF
jgi:hypothetical protein